MSQKTHGGDGVEPRPSPPPTGWLDYAIVPDREINPSYGRAVGRVTATAGRDLGLPRLGVRFVIEAERAPTSWERIRVPDDDDREKWDGGHTPAWTSPERPYLIYLHPLWSGDVVEILLHEARHAWQQHREPALLDPRVFAAEYDRLEADATAYAASSMHRLGLRESVIPARRLVRHF